MKRRVLYVEDNPNNTLLVRRILSAEGHEMLEAVDGEGGWNVAVNERPDLIVMDLLIPGMDGFALARKIKSTPELSHIPIVVLTAHGDPELQRKAEELECDAFLQKPATIPDIQAVLRQFLGAPNKVAYL